MADELDDKLKSVTDVLNSLQDDLKTMRVDFSAFRSALSQITQSVGQLQIPLLTNATSIITSTAAYQQQLIVQQQEIEVTKSKIQQAQLLAQQEQAKIDTQFNLVKELNDQIAVLNAQDGLAVERGNAITEEIALIQSKNTLLKSELASLGKVAELSEDEIAAKQAVIAANKSEIDRLKNLAQVPASMRPTAAKVIGVDESIASMSTEQLQQQISTLEASNAAQESQLAPIVRRVQLMQEIAQNEATEIGLGEERTAQYAQSTALRSEIWDLESRAKTQLEIAEKANAKGQSIIKQKQDAEAKLTVQLKKQEAQLKIDKWTQLSKTFTIVSTALLDLVKTIRDTQNKLGISSTNAVNTIMGNFAQSVKSFFGATTVTGQEILSAQESFRAEFGGVITSAAAKDLAVQAKELGVTTEQLAASRRVFMTSTMGRVGEAKAQSDRFIAEFQKKGLTSKDAMETITKYSEIFARNGTRFQQSFTRAAADAKKIGVDLGKIDQIGDNIIGDFEGFLEKQAELGAMGFNLDSSRLAQLAESGDTGALFNELRSQLATTGKDITKLRRSEQLALSQAFGIPVAELQRMAGPTAGSGEQLTEQEQTNSLLTIIADKAGILAGLLGSLFGLVAGVQTALLNRIALNTGGTLLGIGKTSPSPTAGGTTVSGTTTGPTPAAAPTSAMKALGGAKVGAGLGAISGVVSGIAEYQNSGNIKKALGRGLANLAGSVIGGALGSFIPIPGVGTYLGATAGTFAANWLVDKVFADDMISKPGYGDRKLVTPTATVALNNNDNVVAYADDMVSTAANTVQMLSYGALSKGSDTKPVTTPTLDTTRLEAKLDAVVRAIGTMQVKMDGKEVGKVLVNATEAASQVGVFRRQSTATL